MDGITRFITAEIISADGYNFKFSVNWQSRYNNFTIIDYPSADIISATF